MGRMSTRRGRVVDADGAPVAEAIVTVEWGTAPTPEIALISGPEGEFSLGLPEGRFRVRAIAPDERRGVAEIDTRTLAGPIVVRLAAATPGG